MYNPVNGNYYTFEVKHNMKLVGIDEAGRGSVLGPLVVCGVAIEEERLKYLERLKLKDSKKITPKRRVVLSRKIRKIAECHPCLLYTSSKRDYSVDIRIYIF